jgi:hypothetical protein
MPPCRTSAVASADTGGTARSTRAGRSNASSRRGQRDDPRDRCRTPRDLQPPLPRAAAGAPPGAPCSAPPARDDALARWPLPDTLAARATVPTGVLPGDTPARNTAAAAPVARASARSPSAGTAGGVPFSAVAFSAGGDLSDPGPGPREVLAPGRPSLGREFVLPPEATSTSPAPLHPRRSQRLGGSAPRSPSSHPSTDIRSTLSLGHCSRAGAGSTGRLGLAA